MAQLPAWNATAQWSLWAFPGAPVQARSVGGEYSDRPQRCRLLENKSRRSSVLYASKVLFHTCDACWNAASGCVRTMHCEEKEQTGKSLTGEDDPRYFSVISL